MIKTSAFYMPFALCYQFFTDVVNSNHMDPANVFLQINGGRLRRKIILFEHGPGRREAKQEKIQ